MDARTAESPVISERDSWLQRERASGRFYDRLGWVIAAFLAGMMAFSVWVLRRGAEPGTLLTPPLTVVRQPARDMGRIAAEMLLRRLRGEADAEPQSTILQPELLVRGSCGSTQTPVSWAISER